MTETPSPLPLPDGLLVVPTDDADPRIARRRDGALKHVDHCTAAFAFLDIEHCARCIERANERALGIAPRADHAGTSRGKTARDEADRQAAHRAHFGPGGPHRRGDCGPVCTFGDW